MNLREYLKTTNLITDGAFGTYFAAKYQTQDIPELANITAPEKVKKIHEEYLNAGAKFIRTNTFASNTETLQEDFAEVEKNIQAAVEIARDAVNGRDAWIAGDIGPIPVNGAEDAAAAADEYYQIAKTFAECGVTVLDFETFADLDGILPAIKKICAEYEMFIMVSFSVNQFGYSAAGLSAKRLLADAAAVPEIDAVGLNCGVGPAHMRQILEKAGRPGDKFLLAIPNAGYPTLTRNKLQFGNTPAYFAEKMKELQALGADILGGCCGTTPEFIGEMSSWDGILNKIVLDTETDNGEQTGHVQRHGFLYDENGERKQKKLIAVELAPPFDADDEKLLESAHLLKNAGVDVLTFPDSEEKADGGWSVRCESKSLVGVLACGNLFTGRFAKIIGTTGGAVNYGRYWTTRPKALKVWYKYESGIIDIIGKRPVGDNTQVGDNDRCEIAISVGNWDYKKMGGNPESPVYVNTTEGRYYTEKSDGVIAFGHHVSNQSCDWTQIEIPLNYKTLTERPTHIIVTCAASYLGDYLTGSSSTKLWVDKMELVY